MSGDAHVRICESLGVKFPRATRLFRRLALQKESKVEEGHLMPDHVHMLLSIPPKYAVSRTRPGRCWRRAHSSLGERAPPCSDAKRAQIHGCMPSTSGWASRQG
jgi:REP element-mobilizing transposase RayT